MALLSSLFHRSATSFARGSSGLGALNNAWMDSNTVRICSAGDHLSGRSEVQKTISKKIRERNCFKKTRGKLQGMFMVLVDKDGRGAVITSPCHMATWRRSRNCSFSYCFLMKVTTLPLVEPRNQI